MSRGVAMMPIRGGVFTMGQEDNKKTEQEKIEVEALRRERDELRAGIQNYKCAHCHNITGPLYPVNLMAELTDYREALEHIKRCSHMSSMPELEVVESKIARKVLAKYSKKAE